MAYLALIVTLLTFQNCSRQYRKDGTQTLSSNFTGDHVQKQILVRMKTANMNEAFKSWATDFGLTLENEWGPMNMTHWSWLADMDVNQVDDLIHGLYLANDVEYTEPNYIFNLPSEGVLSASNAMSLGEVEGIFATTSTSGQTAAPVGLVQVRTQLSPGKTPVVVAVIDSGVDLQHELFAGTGALWSNPSEIAGNNFDDDGNGYVDDVNGWNFVSNNNNPDDDNQHGTHCAGIVLGTGQDIFARPLATPKVKIMALKFLSATGGGPTSGAINAIFYAVKNGAKVLSNSWGGGSASRALEDAMNYAYQSNAAFVAAAGNSSTNNDVAPTYPASYLLPNTISVAATTDTDSLATFSNFGPSTVNMSAPGVRILSSVPGNNYAYLSGTSMATPFVAGTAALMMYERPEINGYEVKDLILKKADMVSLSNKVIMNYRLNVLNSVTAVKTATLTGAKPSYSLASADLSSIDASPSGGCGLVGKISNNQGTPDFPLASILLMLLPGVLLLSKKIKYSSLS